MEGEESAQAGNLYLVGPMGVGKTTIGRLLADELGLAFVDTDREIELRAGADIPWIFDVETEAGFRQRESRVLEELSGRSGQVIATGGGIVLAEHNRQCIKDHGRCVYLMADLEQLVARIGKDKKRPLLQKNDPRVVLSDILKARDPLYRDVATWIVPTDTRPPRQVAREIIRLLRKAEARS